MWGKKSVVQSTTQPFIFSSTLSHLFSRTADLLTWMEEKTKNVPNEWLQVNQWAPVHFSHISLHDCDPWRLLIQLQLRYMFNSHEAQCLCVLNSVFQYRCIRTICHLETLSVSFFDQDFKSVKVMAHISLHTSRIHSPGDTQTMFATPLFLFV